MCGKFISILNIPGRDAGGGRSGPREDEGQETLGASVGRGQRIRHGTITALKT